MVTVTGSIGDVVNTVGHFQLYLVLLSGTDVVGDVCFPTGETTVMFADKGTVHRQAGMTVHAVEAEYRPFAFIIGRKGKGFAIEIRGVVLDSIALHGEFAGYLHVVPLVFRGITELPGAAQEQRRIVHTRHL